MASRVVDGAIEFTPHTIIDLTQDDASGEASPPPVSLFKLNCSDHSMIVEPSTHLHIHILHFQRSLWLGSKHFRPVFILFFPARYIAFTPPFHPLTTPCIP